MTIVEQITEWANQSDKPGWWRFTIRKSLESGQLTPSDHEKIFQIAQMEFDLIKKSPDFEASVANIEPTGFSAEEDAYNLASISQVTNVSALSSEQNIPFTPTGITVIYGDNGVGKSSYAKILKNACLTRGDAPEVIPNVFRGSNSTPSAVIEVESNGEKQALTWQKNGEPHEALKSIRVFDSHSSAHYLSKSDSIDYRPAALTLLDELLNTASFISQKCSLEASELRKTLTLPPMHSDTKAGKLASSISSQTTDTEIQEHCATDEETEILENLRKEHLELSSNTPEKLRQRYQTQKGSLEPIRDFLQNLNNQLGDHALEKYRVQYQEYIETRETADKLGQATFSE